MVGRSSESPVVAAEFLVARDVSYGYEAKGRAIGRRCWRSLIRSSRRGEFFCLLGPSGCGKTTVLNLMAGFLRAAVGTLTLDGRPISGPGGRPRRGVPGRRLAVHLAALHRQRRLRPADGGHAANDSGIAVAREFLRLGQSGGPGRQVSRRIVGRDEAARADRPGARQRPEDHADGRAVRRVDAQTRTRLQDELVDIWDKTSKTILFITHDISEAVLLADRIGVMTKGPGARLGEIITVELAAAAPARQRRVRRTCGRRSTP